MKIYLLLLPLVIACGSGPDDSPPTEIEQCQAATLHYFDTGKWECTIETPACTDPEDAVIADDGTRRMCHCSNGTFACLTITP